MASTLQRTRSSPWSATPGTISRTGFQVSPLYRELYRASVADAVTCVCVLAEHAFPGDVTAAEGIAYFAAELFMGVFPSFCGSVLPNVCSVFLAVSEVDGNSFQLGLSSSALQSRHELHPHLRDSARNQWYWSSHVQATSSVFVFRCCARLNPFPALGRGQWFGVHQKWLVAVWPVLFSVYFLVLARYSGCNPVLVQPSVARGADGLGRHESRQHQTSCGLWCSLHPQCKPVILLVFCNVPNSCTRGLSLESLN